jgi:hypothetical protein
VQVKLDDFGTGLRLDDGELLVGQRQDQGRAELRSARDDWASRLT